MYVNKGTNINTKTVHMYILMIGVYEILANSGFFSRDEPDVTSNMQDRPACNIICVAIHNKLPAGHILLPTT